VGGLLVLYLLAGLALLGLTPVTVYRLLALVNASYTLGRDGLRLRWGLRSEDIPLDDVEWVRAASDFGSRLKQPLFSVPGAILGTRQLEGIGLVEFIASDAALLLVATARKVYAVSPADAPAFANAFQKSIEMGSLSPLQSSSTLPAAFLRSVWTDRLARLLILLGFGFGFGLLALVSLLIPGLTTVSLGFQPGGQPGTPGPAARLLLLPVMMFFIYLMDLAVGLMFYRDPANRPVSYLLWGTAPVTSILLMLATFILI
jgi:hypothetical protein